MAKTEDIEAKLAAYVDGELDAAGRAQIEEYLVANPQHRQLLTELMQQRDLLRGLPRHLAPADIAESFNAQLERAVLLGDVDGGGTAVPRRIGFWPQLRAVAAVLVLAGVLAGMIYYFLPPQNGGTTLADLHMAPSPTTEPLAVLEQEKLDAAMAPASDLAKRGGETLVMGTTTSPASERDEGALAMDDRKVQGGAGFSLAGRAAEGNMSDRLMASNTASAGQQMFSDAVASAKTAPATSPGNSLVYVLPTENAQGVNDEVTRYLTDNHIQWDMQPEPMPAPLTLQQSQIVSATRLQQQSVQLKSMASEAPIQKPESNVADVPAPSGPQRIIARQVSREQAAQVMASLDQIQMRMRQNQVKDSQQMPSIPATGVPAGASPTTMPQVPRLLPMDVFAFNSMMNTTLKLSPPTTQLAEDAAMNGQSKAFDLPAPLAAQDKVDLTIVLQPPMAEPAPEPSTTEPSTTAPAP